MSFQPLSRPLLVAHDLTKTFTQGVWPKRRSHKALDNANLIVRCSRTLALIGKSGSGKSTLAMCLAGLERADAGEVWFDDGNRASIDGRLVAKSRREIQIIFQDSSGSLSPRLSATEIVQEPLLVLGAISRREREETALQLMLQVGLSPGLKDRRSHQMSGGQRQRLAIARALALRPRLLILDEPFTGLDLSVRGQIINLLIDLQAERGLSYLYISHDLDVVDRFADEVAVMDGGKIVECGQTPEVLAKPTHPSTKSLIDACSALAGRAHYAKGASCGIC